MPGVLVPQLEQTVFTKLHNCTTSNPRADVTTVRLWLPKLTPAQGLVGIPEPAGDAKPVILKFMAQLELYDVGQFAQRFIPLQSI